MPDETYVRGTIETFSAAGKTGNEWSVFFNCDLKSQHGGELYVPGHGLATHARQDVYDSRTACLNRIESVRPCAFSWEAADTLPVRQQLDGITRVRFPDKIAGAVFHTFQTVGRHGKKSGPDTFR